MATWNENLAEIWQLVSMTPQEFKGGGIWNIVVQINDALQAIGYGLLVLFFAIGLFKNTVNFQELRRPEAAPLLELAEADVPTQLIHHTITNTAREGSGIRLRMISQEKPHPDAVSVPANLEEVFLYHCGEESM